MQQGRNENGHPQKTLKALPKLSFLYGVNKQLLQIILLIALVPVTAFAQDRESKMDSLWKAAAAENDPLEKSEILLLYAQYINAVSNDSAIAFTDSLIGFYENEGFEKAYARARSMKLWFLNFQARYEEAIRIGHQVLKIQRRINDSLGIALTLNRIGATHLYFGRFGDAEKYLSKALERFTAMKDTVRIDVALNNLGVVASEQKDFRKSNEYFRKSLGLRLQIGNFHWVAYQYYNIADSYFSLRQLDSAKHYLLLSVETFETKTDHKTVPPMVEVRLGELYGELGDYEQALKFSRRALQKAEAANHKDILIGIRKTLANLLYETGRYKEGYEMNLLYQDLKNEIDSANNAAQVAEIEGKYKTAEKEAEIAHLESETLEAQNTAQRSWMFALLAMLIGAMIIALLVFLYQRRLRKQQISEADLKAKISEIRMMALRAQMNPHFIFNCINTTQNFVLNSEKEKAYDYLAKFARLLRMVLENSNKKLVPLEDEVEQVSLYIELEAIRFGGKFDYEIKVDPELENGVFEIPGMVLQPLVENAILHGLMNRKDDSGKLEISITKEDETIRCEITDNGVGRKKAAAIKARKKKHYQSAALPNISARIDILRKESKDKIGLEVIDLENNREAIGTKVRLVLPYS